MPKKFFEIGHSVCQSKSFHASPMFESKAKSLNPKVLHSAKLWPFKQLLYKPKSSRDKDSSLFFYRVSAKEYFVNLTTPVNVKNFFFTNGLKNKLRCSKKALIFCLALYLLVVLTELSNA